jgi:hypothetical protein
MAAITNVAAMTALNALNQASAAVGQSMVNIAAGSTDSALQAAIGPAYAVELSSQA